MEACLAPCKQNIVKKVFLHSVAEQSAEVKIFFTAVIVAITPRSDMLSCFRMIGAQSTH